MDKAFYSNDVLGGCACARLIKRRRKRKVVGAPKYVAWLEKKTKATSKKVRAFFKEEARRIAYELTHDTHHTFKAANDPPLQNKKSLEEAVNSLDFSRWTAITGIFDEDLYAAFLESSKSAFDMIGFDPSEDITNLLNEQAKAYAKERGAELVGKKYDEAGNLIDNPDDRFAITETTRDELRNLVEDAIDEGWSADDLANEIEGSYAFSESRAETIARTELAFAHTQGNLDSWEEAGVEQKESILGSEHDMDDECDDNASTGPIPIDQPFPSGDDGPPYHPNCVCALVPVLASDQPQE